MNYLFKLLFSLCLAVGLTACDRKSSTSSSTENQKIKVAVTEISASILSPSIDWLKQQGVEVELVIMAGNVNVIHAANDGSVDAALGVHIKFMESFNANNKGQLAMVKPYAFTTGIGLYSEKYKTLDELPVNAKIAIMNDAMNMDRGLRMMRDAGVIELNTEKANGYTVLDITDNPKNIAFIDMNQVQTVRALQDIDAAVVFFTHMRNAGKDFTSYIIRDTDAADYPMGIVVHQKHTQQPWAKLLAQALLQESVRDNLEKQFGGVFEYYK